MERMNFNEFKDAVVDGIKAWLPKSMARAEVSICEITKNNNSRLNGLKIISNGSKITPVIYLEGFYEDYKKGEEMRDILKNIAQVRMQHEMNEPFNESCITNFKKCQDRILPRLIGVKWNTELLKNNPHIIVEDLAVVFYITMGVDENTSMSVLIQNELMNMWGVTVEELFERAIMNLSDLETGEIASMDQIIIENMVPEFMEEYNMDRETAEQIVKMNVPADNRMYVLTNKNKVYGASMLLDKKTMRKVIDTVGSDFYILPSSIHECIILVAELYMDPVELKEIVREINVNQVPLEDQLSDNVYRYTLSEGIKLA